MQPHMDFQIGFLNRGLWAVRTFIHGYLPAGHVSLFEMTFQPLISRVATAAIRLEANELAFGCLESPGELSRDPAMGDHSGARHIAAKEFL